MSSTPSDRTARSVLSAYEAPELRVLANRVGAAEALAKLHAGDLGPGLMAHVDPEPGAVESDAATTQQGAARFVVPGDDEYPGELLAVLGDDRPLGLWVLGTSPLLDAVRTSVAITGGSSATEYGRHVAQTLAGDVAESGRTVAAAMMFGIGMATLRSATTYGRALAVLATGVDVVFPRDHGPLQHAIVEKGGHLVSEYGPGAPVSRARARRRAQLLTALAPATVVVEASLFGNTMEVARGALALGRPVWAVPGPVTSELSTGPHQLLREGAQVATGGADFLS
ncbi:DNA-processing protein DprA [Kitasatospora purpeofusca]|uniref:DNA-processing protein DprA n=1 Tax=Kitasatospora purpeofusca TaxID=67352 RepID=UPI0036A5AE5C